MSLKDSALLVKLTRRAFNPKIRDVAATAKVNEMYQSADGADVYKNLFKKSKVISNIRSKSTDQYQFHMRWTLPWLDGGTRLLVSKFYDDYIDGMGRRKADMESLLAAITPEEYDAIVKSDMADLAGLANASDYPTLSDLKSSFGSDIRLFPVPDSNDFRVQVSQQHKDQLDKMVEETGSLARDDLHKRVEKCLGRIVEQCSKENPRIFDSMLESTIELSEVMKILNVHNDTEINSLSEELYKLGVSVNTFQLRTSENARKELASRASKLISSFRGGSTDVSPPTTTSLASVKDDII